MGNNIEYRISINDNEGVIDQMNEGLVFAACGWLVEALEGEENTTAAMTLEEEKVRVFSGQKIYIIGFRPWKKRVNYGSITIKNDMMG